MSSKELRVAGICTVAFPFVAILVWLAATGRGPIAAGIGLVYLTFACIVAGIALILRSQA